MHTICSDGSVKPHGFYLYDSIILVVYRYFCYLYFQLKTHSDLFASEEGSEDTPALSLVGALSFLGVITIIVAVCSE